MTRIGVVGAGRVGAVLAAALRAAGHEISRGRRGVPGLPHPHRDPAARRPRRQAHRGLPLVRPAAAHRPRRHARQRGQHARGQRRDPARPVRRAHLRQARARGPRAGRRARRPRARDAPRDDVHRHRRGPRAGCRLRRSASPPTEDTAVLAETLVADLGGRVVWVPEERRALYHAGLAHGANHLVTLVAAGDGPAPRVRRRRPGRHAAPAAHRGPRQRPVLRRRGADRADRPR